MTRADREIVLAVQTALAKQVGKDRYQIWFGRGVRMEPCGTTLRIAAADSFRLDNLRRMFRVPILTAMQEAGAENWDLEFTVDAEISVAACDGDEIPRVVLRNEQAARSSSATTYGPAEDNHATVGIAPAAVHKLPRRTFSSLDDFHAGEANRLAFSAAQTAAERPGTYSPLTLVGPPGSGKTHLLEGIWRKVRQQQVVQRVIYLSAEQFTNQFLDALRNSGTPNFRRKFRDVEVLLIDDLQFFAGKQSTILELLHTVDTLLRENRQLVFASQRPPGEIRGLGPELTARLAGGLVCKIALADFGTRLGILEQLVRRKNLAAPQDVISWLANQLDGDARQLTGAVNRLKAASEAHGRSIDLPFAEQCLGDLILSSRPPIRVPEILDAVCDVFGVQPGELQAGGKSTNVATPRMLVMFLARKWTRSALSEISRTLGRKSHSTVLSAEQKVTQWLAQGKLVPLSRGRCRVEDAIKQIETQLRLA